MDKHEEISELNAQLRQNKESTEILQRRLSEIHHEEDIYQSDFKICTVRINRLSDILCGSVFAKLQSDAHSSVDELSKKVEKAFQSEHEQLKERLQSFDRERDILTNRKKALEEEAE